MKCPRCKVDLELGQAIRAHPPHEGRCGCFGHGLLTIENLSFQFCGKCPKCGHSDDNVVQWKDEIIAQIGFDKWNQEYGKQYANIRIHLFQ